MQQAIGNDSKGILSIVFYSSGILLSYFSPTLTIACYVITAIMWFIPDRRFAAVLNKKIEHLRMLFNVCLNLVVLDNLS
ncbi:hypothetical protein [Streptococcus parauberis]|uniref:Conserved domain protein n=1 Tax=Streptococcus parauberis NCFD 2020 TaxID=873447 RepID=F1YY32_9STRE|nr:hypothetical protein [Streptococcus parauberis]EGE53967.1 conserved domain protein [Streptococcus parauberis NCFD 2020]MDT2748748.1 hypothetical protein [Streptococcus parauberis]